VWERVIIIIQSYPDDWCVAMKTSGAETECIRLTKRFRKYDERNMNTVHNVVIMNGAD